METMSNFETWQICIGIASVLAVLFAAIMAIWIGQNQNIINNRLLQLQDYVAITAVPNGDTIALWNTGNSNLYMWGFDMPGNNQRLIRPRLISPSTVANYWIPAPHFTDLDKNSATTTFDFKLYLTDEYGNKWISEHGGEAKPSMISRDDKEIAVLHIKVWSYNTTRENWELNE